MKPTFEPHLEALTAVQRASAPKYLSNEEASEIVLQVESSTKHSPMVTISSKFSINFTFSIMKLSQKKMPRSII